MNSSNIPNSMTAMVLESSPGKLVRKDLPVPQPGSKEILIKVEACGVCRTDLHVVDGELPNPKPELIPGHEIIGKVIGTGAAVTSKHSGDRVGVPWVGWTCGECFYCKQEQENLCEEALFTGYTKDGGYCEFTTSHEEFCYIIDERLDPITSTPFLCAGSIGYRTYRKTLQGSKNIGIYGFGAAAHLIAQLAIHEGKRIFAFTKPDDHRGQQFAKNLGAVWVGGSDQLPPEALDSAMIFAPVGNLVVEALRALRPGGNVVCGGIHMSDIPSFSYDLLWQERSIESVANLERSDCKEFLKAAPEVPIRTHTKTYPLSQANEALDDLRNGKFQGAAVLVP